MIFNVLDLLLLTVNNFDCATYITFRKRYGGLCI